MIDQTKFKETVIGKNTEDWDIKTVQELIISDIIEKPLDGNHGNIHPKESDYVNNGIPFIMASDLKNGSIDIVNCKFIKREQADRLQKGFAKTGDVLLTHKATIGRVAVVEKIKTDYIMLIPQVTYYRIKDYRKLDNYFLKYYFDSVGFKKLFNSWAGGGSTRAYLGIQEQKKLPILLPPIAEQRAIASILSSLDDKITLNRSMNTTLEAIGQALFRRWFVDFEFPNEEGKPYRSSGGEMVETEHGEVPKGWRIMTVGEILELAYGKPLKDENRLKGNVPVYGSNGQIGWHNEKLVEGPGIVVGRKGNPGIVTWSHKAFFPIDTTFYVVPKAIRSMYYLFYILRLQDLQSLGADSAVPGLNRNVVYMNKMIVPSSETLEIFDAFLRKIYNKVQNNNEQSDILTEIRDALLPKLMSGEIKVR